MSIHIHFLDISLYAMIALLTCSRLAKCQACARVCVYLHSIMNFTVTKQHGVNIHILFYGYNRTQWGLWLIHRSQRVNICTIVCSSKLFHTHPSCPALQIGGCHSQVQPVQRAMP